MVSEGAAYRDRSFPLRHTNEPGYIYDRLPEGNGEQEFLRRQSNKLLLR